MAIKSNEAAEVLRNKLKLGYTKFVFKKKDGSRREAMGTTNLEAIPQEFWPKDMDNEEQKPRNEAIVTYYDMEKGAWRSCKVENILEIEGMEVCDD